MEADFWHARWEKSEIGFHQQEINVHLQEFWGEVAPADGELVFVPLCGKSRDLLWLRSLGYRVLGVELSPIAVSDFFREHGLMPRQEERGNFLVWEVDGLSIFEGDLFNLTAGMLSEVKAVYDRASLVALPEEMRASYVEQLRRILPAGAETLLVTLEYLQAEMDGPPFSVEEPEVQRLYGGSHRVECLADIDILAENPRFQQKGLSRFDEKVYRLSSR
jgi:thiopurine S-methyltransferase